MFKLLFVCMANVCRSPMAQGIVRTQLQHKGLAQHFTLESAGTHVRRVGQKPDPRVVAVAAQHGYHGIDRLRSRTLEAGDFERFDHILAMDLSNLAKLQSLCPAEHSHKLHLLLDFADDVPEREVPDPYYGNLEGFERVLRLCEAGSRGLIEACMRSVAAYTP